MPWWRHLGRSIAGAGLDVYEDEPKLAPGCELPNTILLPHLGSATLEARTKMATMAAANLIAGLEESAAEFGQSGGAVGLVPRSFRVHGGRKTKRI